MGRIEVKGAGHMEVWHVLGRKKLEDDSKAPSMKGS
jgi:hypothetical protein